MNYTIDILPSTAGWVWIAKAPDGTDIGHGIEATIPEAHQAGTALVNDDIRLEIDADLETYL